MQGGGVKPGGTEVEVIVRVGPGNPMKTISCCRIELSLLRTSGCI